MCGVQEEGESEMHRICNLCLDKKEGRRFLESTQASISRICVSATRRVQKKASSASASRKRLALAQKLEVLKLLDRKVPHAEIEIARRFGCGTTAIGTIKQARSKLEGDAASSARSASSKSSRGGDFPKVRPLLWFKIEREERTNSNFAETCPLFVWCLAPSSQTFSKFLLLRERHIFWLFFHRQELPVNL